MAVNKRQGERERRTRLETTATGRHKTLEVMLCGPEL